LVDIVLDNNSEFNIQVIPQVPNVKQSPDVIYQRTSAAFTNITVKRLNKYLR